MEPDMMTENAMIEQPEKFHHDGEVTFLKFPSGWKRSFIRGGIAFPEYDKDRRKFIGSLSVCGLGLNNIATLYLNENFEKYDFRLAELFKKINDRYGVSKFYYCENSNGRESARKFSITAGLRRRENRDSVYPILLSLSFPSDYHAMESFMIRSSDGTVDADENTNLVKAISGWMVDDGLSKTPPEIKSFIYNLAGIDRDFIHYRQGFYS